MMDSQYLPVTTKPDGKAKSIRDEIVIDKLESRKWLYKDVPLYLPPQIFSRIDRPVEYAYRNTQVHKEGYTDPSTNRDPHLIGACTCKPYIKSTIILDNDAERFWAKGMEIWNKLGRETFCTNVYPRVSRSYFILFYWQNPILSYFLGNGLFYPIFWPFCL